MCLGNTYNHAYACSREGLVLFSSTVSVNVFVVSANIVVVAVNFLSFLLQFLIFNIISVPLDVIFLSIFQPMAYDEFESLHLGLKIIFLIDYNGLQYLCNYEYINCDQLGYFVL